MTIKIIIFSVLTIIWLISLIVLGFFAVFTNKNAKNKFEKKLKILNDQICQNDLKIESTYFLNEGEWAFFEEKNYQAEYFVCKKNKKLFDKNYIFLDRVNHFKVAEKNSVFSNILITNKYLIFNIEKKIYKFNLDHNLNYVFNLRQEGNYIIFAIDELKYFGFKISLEQCCLIKKITSNPNN